MVRSAKLWVAFFSIIGIFFACGNIFKGTRRNNGATKDTHVEKIYFPDKIGSVDISSKKKNHRKLSKESYLKETNFIKIKDNHGAMDESSIKERKSKSNFKESRVMEDADFPNIVFMMTDDMGYGDLGYSGGKASTPHLDAMASGPNTIHFTRFYSGAPVCSPTRGTVLTGRNHNRYCIWNANAGGSTADFVVASPFPLPSSEITVADILKKHGYQTAIFGKWHVGDLKVLAKGHKKWPVSHPGMHGFDEWLVTVRSAPSTDLNCGCFARTEANCTLGHYPIEPSCTNYYTMKDKERTLDPLHYPIVGDDSHFIVEQFENFLDKATKMKKPFFAYLPFHTAHIRYIAAKGYREMYSPEIYTEEEIDYYGAISALDDAIGKTRKLLVKYNVGHNTMLWFANDNGPQSMSPGVTAGFRGRKRSLYEGGIRFPGLIEWPAMITKNIKTSFPVMTNDLLPTACDIVGSTPPKDRPIDGVSILPFIRGKTNMRNSSMKWAFGVNGNFRGSYQAAISDDQYKLYAIYKNDRMERTELYDLTKDPYEKNDIKFNTRDIHDRLINELGEWHQSVKNSAKNVVKCI